MMLKGALILCTLIALAAKATTEIRSDWKEYGYKGGKIDKQFYVFNNKLNWTDARDACKKKEMALATTTTHGEKWQLEYSLILLDVVPEDQYSGYWIGSYRNSIHDPWVWETNNNEINSRIGWLPGEPNAYEGEDCMEFKNDMGNLGWNNLSCDNLRGYICEGSLSDTSELKKISTTAPKF